MDTIREQKQLSASDLARKFASYVYGVPGSSVFITLNVPARGTKMLPGTQSIEFDVVFDNGNQERHMVAVNVSKQEVTLIF